MPTYLLTLFSIVVYGMLLWAFWKKPSLLDLRGWPKHPTLSRIWWIWVVFLTIFAPLTYYEGDMGVWTGAIESLFTGQPLASHYVYLPVYAEFQAALLWPFQQLGIVSHLLTVYIVNGFVIFTYVYSAKLMAALIAEVAPASSELAPLGIVIAPVTIYYLFFGTNHIVMFFLLLCTLTLLRKQQWFWAGLFAGLSAYKFMLIPTLLVLFAMLLGKYPRKTIWMFILGGLISLIPSILYYIFNPEVLSLLLARRAAVGAHSYHIERFHFLYLLSKHIPNLTEWYIDKQMWFYLTMLGIPVSLLLYIQKRLTVLQTLAFSYGFVVLFAPEPFRLEPLIGLLWLDAVFRCDLRLQAAIFGVLFTHAAAWFDRAYPHALTLDPAMPVELWEARGLYIGLAVILALGIAITGQDKRDLILTAPLNTDCQK